MRADLEGVGVEEGVEGVIESLSEEGGSEASLEGSDRLLEV